MLVGSVLSGFEAGSVNNDQKMSIQLIFGVGKVCVWRVKNEVFSKFGDLGGDFYKDTHEPKLFGIHIGSVLSSFEAGNEHI